MHMHNAISSSFDLNPMRATRQSQETFGCTAEQMSSYKSLIGAYLDNELPSIVQEGIDILVRNKNMPYQDFVNQFSTKNPILDDMSKEEYEMFHASYEYVLRIRSK